MSVYYLKTCPIHYADVYCFMYMMPFFLSHTLSYYYYFILVLRYLFHFLYSTYICFYTKGLDSNDQCSITRCLHWFFQNKTSITKLCSFFFITSLLLWSIECECTLEPHSRRYLWKWKLKVLCHRVPKVPFKS